jgi:Uma2 family endonuclease
MATRPDLSSLPAPDERLVMPESGYEIVAGEVVRVSPAHEPHGSRHSKLSALLEAYVADGYLAASDMLTRTSERDDFAPDGSIYPADRDPATGGRRLEELAFEVVSTESLAHAGRKAASLVARGVRRVFAIDVDRGRGLEWSRTTDTWEILASGGVIEDRALVLPLAVHDLVEAASADDAMARALLAKRNPVLVAAMLQAKLDAKVEAIITVLVARGLAPTESERAALLAMTDEATIERWLAAVATVQSVADLLGSMRPR